MKEGKEKGNRKTVKSKKPEIKPAPQKRRPATQKIKDLREQFHKETGNPWNVAGFNVAIFEYVDWLEDKLTENQ